MRKKKNWKQKHHHYGSTSCEWRLYHVTQWEYLTSWREISSRENWSTHNQVRPFNSKLFSGLFIFDFISCFDHFLLVKCCDNSFVCKCSPLCYCHRAQSTVSDVLQRLVALFVTACKVTFELYHRVNQHRLALFFRVLSLLIISYNTDEIVCFQVLEKKMSFGAKLKHNQQRSNENIKVRKCLEVHFS